MAGRRDLTEIVSAALSQFADLSGCEPESVSGVRKNGDGWSVLVDVVDLERVPPTTSVLSTYRIDLDGEATLIGYERLRRFTRAATGSAT